MTGVDARDRRARVVLSVIGEPGDVRMASLTDELGAALLLEHLVAERDAGGLQTDLAARLAGVDADRELEAAARLGLRFVVPGDDEWPTQLDALRGAGVAHERGGVPVGLWVRGPLRLDGLADGVAVVGSRDSTTYGEDVARDIAVAVAETGRPVVSGGAFGIDIAAHRGALAVDGPTVAVLACGADRAYPLSHRALIEHLAEAGAVVSEAAPGCAPQRVRFLARNRLIAGLTRATVVVEAARRSGALSTAGWARRLNRTVLGVPGPVTSVVSEGVHDEIRTGAMELVAGGADVLEMLGAAGEHLITRVGGEERPRDRLTVRERQLLDAVPVATGAGTVSVARVAGLGLVEARRLLERLHRGDWVEHGDEGWRLGPAGRA